MADGLNQARAWRVSELMNDFRNVQHFLASIRVSPSAEEYNEDGYVVLRQCVAEAQALLQQPFHTQTTSSGNLEQDKTHLRRIIIDAAVRRFRAQRLYFRAVAALRWVNARTALLRGQRAQPQHAAQLQHIRNVLRSELAGLTGARIEQSLRAPDEAARKWLAEDPSFDTLLRLAGQ